MLHGSRTHVRTDSGLAAALLVEDAEAAGSLAVPGSRASAATRQILTAAVAPGP
ncbi:hypothetical protein [Yinghuangia soli]|uniref:Uncharacterized protein n=1 Tax=Yinghuangia soli TaxID=2908204 RepID=A0AA41U4P3_9ACTN|nr:hypothetical protein [Yinghuangia soli]MCF2533145.1 hypothetical protein [Yinghuangia soli]